MSHGPKDESSGMGFDIPCAGLNYHDYSGVCVCVWEGGMLVGWGNIVIFFSIHI